ncbi:synaptotagmin-17 isoform X10 [Hirundo rustica]|uniref:synaptotagmin-17 isoform X10 n=1 Tax=Hirundo rustica TaxID=43150 RepID=UPI001A9436A1|nr:synaptotagmin-17 isoform X10 [Hirundo rustica]XP_039935157.1 synaptotagmin-17 isoform X10 [Hirundo rustica]XP_039935158.1 synaptotagmin-17 isoform X10 [Hirundo rustica]XP_058278590.1 synaptotagmin-17 isoform X10 [Hirundo rustica]
MRISSQNEDKDGDSDNTISELPPTLQDVSPDRRRSSSDTSRSTYSLTRRISRAQWRRPALFFLPKHERGLEARRPSSPLVDIKPIEFGVIGAKKEIVQPTILRKTYTPDDYFRKFEPRLYSLDSNSDDMDSLTDEEILSKYQLGMLHFSTQYDLLHNYLIVRVIEAKDLPPPISYDGSRQDMAHSNPYVKICLLPDQKNSKQTGVKRKTQNPVFEERYTFEIPFLEAQRRTLLLTVVDFDKFSRHCVIGKVSMPLSDVDLVKGGHWWKALVPSSQNEVELGELLLSLNYLPSAGRLNVDIIRAKQLLQTDMSQGSDPFVKIQLVHGLKLTKTKKTSCMRGTIDPFYNESFSFKVPQEELENASLVFTEAVPSIATQQLDLAGSRSCSQLALFEELLCRGRGGALIALLSGTQPGHKVKPEKNERTAVNNHWQRNFWYLAWFAGERMHLKVFHTDLSCSVSRACSCLCV